MSDAAQIELIRALAVVPGAIGSIAAAWFAYRAATHAKDAIAVSERVERNTNGITSKLLSLTATSSEAVGVLKEKQRTEINHENQ